MHSPLAGAGSAARALRLARRAALALSLLAFPAARADAQAACTAGTFADYSAAGFACRIGAWVFSGFNFEADAVTEGGGTSALPDRLTTTLTPFVGTDAAGRTTFGFDFVDFTARASIDGATDAAAFADAFAFLGFQVASDVPGAGLAGGRLLGTQFVTGPAAPPLFPSFGLESGHIASVTTPVGSLTPGLCLFVIDVARSAVDKGVEFADPCTSSALQPDAPTSAQVSLAPFARVERTTPGTDPFTAAARTSLTRFELVQAPSPAVVPEPASVALLGSGLVGLVGVAARRRRGAAGSR